MDLDKYIELAEKMVIAAEEYIEANNTFENYKGNLTSKEFELMINESKKSRDKYNKIQVLEDRLCKAERKMKFY